MSGKVGNITYMQTKYGTVAFPSKKKAKVPRRSERQMEIRTQWVNLGAVYHQFNETLKKAYEDVGKMSVYNAFVQANINVVRVYITKQERLNGGSVLAPYLITRGSLPSISWSVNDSNVLVTDIALGGLETDANTTVGQFSTAVVQNNPDYKLGDQITFFYGVQTIDTVTAVPRAKITGTKILLDANSQAKLWDVVGNRGFNSVATATGTGYRLGMGQAINSGAAAWVHSREGNDGTLKVSSQFLYVDTAILNSYMDGSAFDTSVNSYGGINTSAVFLDPKSYDELEAGGYVEEETGGSQNDGNGSSTGSETGGNGSSTGSDTGGGSQTVTVAQPQFSGETQFTESTQVSMSAESGAEIRYTTDGSTPTASSSLYSAPITLTDTTTVKAIAIKDGVSSAVTSRVYTKSAGNGGGSGDGGGDMD